jgi:uncharacterized membrane protein
MNVEKSQLVIAVLLGIGLNFLLPFTYNSNGLVAKSIFSVDNYGLSLFYAFLFLLLLSTVTKKDINNKGKLLLDKPKNIPTTILRSVLEIVFGLVLLFLVPLFGGAILYWSGIPMELVVLVCLGYIGGLIYLGKKYYWK